MPPYLPIAIALIKRFEGCPLKVYQDPVGIWTIGWGFTGAAIRRDTPDYTQAQADQELSNRLTKLDYMLGLDLFITINNHQRAALLSLGWNIGLGNLSHSTLLKLVNDGAFGAAAAQFGMWTFAKGIQLRGLVVRREAERACFETADSI